MVYINRQKLTKVVLGVTLFPSCPSCRRIKSKSDSPVTSRTALTTPLEFMSYGVAWLVQKRLRALEFLTGIQAEVKRTAVAKRRKKRRAIENWEEDTNPTGRGAGLLY